jgi:membrane fusion protein (multidrug efflux system)
MPDTTDTKPETTAAEIGKPASGKPDPGNTQTGKPDHGKSPAGQPQPNAKPKAKKGRRFLLFIVLPALAAAGGLFAYLHGGRYVSTDNAYVGAQKVLITPEVSGRVTRISVQEGQQLKVGDELFEIDPAPYRIAVESAEAKLAQVKTEFATVKDNLNSLTRLGDLARQTVALRQADVARKTELLNNRTASRADVDSSEIALTAARNQVEQIEQQRVAALNQLTGNPDLQLDQYPPYIDATATLDRARRDLTLTHLTAPIAGTATQVSSIQMGRYLSAGSAVFSIVESDKPWVDANPKETDLTYLKPGQEVTITVDAYPGREWRGSLASISPGTGAQFSILPAQNASGNWVKVVQRVPVRIEFAPGEDTTQLRAGMSANVDIDTKRERSLAHLFGIDMSASALASQLPSLSPNAAANPSPGPSH